MICYFVTLIFLVKSKKISFFQKCFYVVYSSVLFVISTAAYIGLAFEGQNLWILNRNYPGGPPAYFGAYQSTAFSLATNVLETAINLIADALLVCIQDI
jgi:hypothetical protein